MRGRPRRGADARDRPSAITSLLPADALLRDDAAAQAKANVELYRLFFEYNPLPVWACSAGKLRFLAVNDTAIEHYGYEREEFLSMSLREIHPHEDVPELIEYFDHDAMTPLPPRVWRHCTKSGGMIHVEMLTQPIMLGGKPARMVVANDVTEHERAEEELRRQASLLDLAHDAIIVRDLEGRVSFWNRGAERLYGWTAEEVRGRRVTDFFYADTILYERAMRSLVEHGQWRGEMQQVRKNGSDIVAACRWTLMRDEDGEAISVIAINTDITEQKKLEQQFLRAQRLESIGTLASGVAHDLNNVLVPILMVAPLLRSEVSPEDREKFLNIVESSAERGASIVRQVLTFARGAQGNHLLLQPIHLIEEMGNLVRETFPKSISVQTSYPENVSAIEADQTQLHQVLLNLAVNARDAMPEGGTLTLSAINIEITEEEASVTPGAQPGRYVLLQVRDTGAGIPQQVMAKIFDPFFTTKDIGVGTGLGLSTVLGIVKSHGGFVNVYSQPGETIFKVFLPAAAPEEHSLREKSAASLPRGQGETIMIVDDEPGIREMARAFLEQQGYQAFAAEDAPSALALFAQRPTDFHLVLTDVGMPIVDGLTLVRAMRKMHRGIKAIVSSGREEMRRSEMEALGIEACLTKPYTLDNLLQTLDRVLHQTPPRAS